MALSPSPRWGVTVVDVFLLLFFFCINTLLNSPDQQSDKTSAFIEALTLTDSLLIYTKYKYKQNP